ncbi:DHH family phosphoesterase [Kovacikia minuta CCNUW1]|uniref:single-stranded-DNA-specific exonuclease RecJ n=1 Tax=Kovacikia minuta TaxID=2931930 RepID=UPI001CC9F46F|nr:DHH family phosphoesterase [Kovacikia minuta]UBF26866.1 DHH family phosphoesterase [Kovacikia minuta CCNUW1]
MSESSMQWQIQSRMQLPDWFVAAVQPFAAGSPGECLAQLLWQRGIQDADLLAGFLDADRYQPSSPFEFGQEMRWAVERLRQARTTGEGVAIWGDFDADGVTATAVLWDGLGQFFAPQKTLFYYIPNRLTESHGLSRRGIDFLHARGCRLIVTCDTGSTSLDEIEYARSLGIDAIVTDHHTLPDLRPPVTAIINPRYLPANHPLATLSGVAVAFKLVEALYATLPEIPQKPLLELLDLVAIGLIADLVELQGDCRYLAQRGIEQLQKQSNPLTATRPGVAKLLEFCKRSGDRPTDISFGLGPRINAVSRIQGDAHFCVELLTSQDAHLCTHLAEATELANTRRKALQKEVAQQVITHLARLDLSTTSVIVLADEQWQVGVLGLVAGQIAQAYGRPTILLSTEGAWLGSQESGVRSQEPGGRGDEAGGESEEGEGGNPVPSLQFKTQNLKLKTQYFSPLARGSARSVNNIDLYQLVKEQAHLLERFGGHPYAAGLSLPVANIPLFTEAINQQLRQSADAGAAASLQIDLVVTVAELGKQLFQALKLLEPCGMGNPVPKLLVQNCWFEKVWNRKIRDRKGAQVQYIKTEFELWDESVTTGFTGVWWGHYKEDIPTGRCDAIVELDFNTYMDEAKGKKPHYEVRLIAVRSHDQLVQVHSGFTRDRWILDWRGQTQAELEGEPQRDADAEDGIQEPKVKIPPSALRLSACPTNWTDLQVWFRRAWQEQRQLAIVYPPPAQTPPSETWQRFVGIAKFLSRTGQSATRQQILEKLEIGDRTLQLGLKTLTYLGFTFSYRDNGLQVIWQASDQSPGSEAQFTEAVEQFLIAVKEEQFRRQYFYQVPLATIQAVARQTIAGVQELGVRG